MELFKISDNYYLNKELARYNENLWLGEDSYNDDYICIVESNSKDIVFAISLSFYDLLDHIEYNEDFYKDLPTHFYNITNGEDFLMHHFYFVKYCIENLNFSENNFKEDLAKYIIKILKNMVFI